VVPKENKAEKRVMVGIAVSLDAAHAVVAKTINAEGGVRAPAIPRGATVTAVNGTAVSNFYDIIREIKRNAGKRIVINYRTNEGQAGKVAANTAVTDLITVESVFAKPVPFDLLKKLYKADGPVTAMEMGYKKTIDFIASTYVTLKRLVSGLVSPKELMGPVGIVTVSYRIVAEEPLIYYVYFLGLISAAIAVFNFLPLPPLDGGLIVLLTIEKIKGSVLSERTMGIIAYAGWALIIMFFLYITFNDVARSFFGS
jgi:regulator of sigma E protease